MKKVLLATAAVILMTGCSQNEEFENEAQNAKINFGSIVRNSTRADILTTSTISTFTVSGYKTTGAMAEGTQLTTGFIDALVVTKGAENKWAYTGDAFYWPFTEKVQFFATSPAQAQAVTAPGYPTFEYTVKAVADQEDLVAANLIDKDKMAGDLTFPFQHLLTQVNFSIKGDTPGFTYTVTKLVLKGVKDKAKFTFDGTNTVGSWTGLTAAVPETSLDLTCNKTVTPTSVTPDIKTSLEESGKALFMLLPQDATTITAEITYSSGDAGFSGTKTVALTGTWEKGHSIRYVLKLTADAKPITFGKPSVGDWTTDEDSNIEPKN